MWRVNYVKSGVVAGVAMAMIAASLPAQSQNKTPSQPAARAQPAQQPAPPAPSAQPANPQSSWNARCTSPSRQAPLECIIEQQVIVQSTGQQVSLVSIRVPGETRQPVVMIQLPLGLHLPAGLTLQVDEGKGQSVAIQSCDQRACYVGLPLNPDLLESMKKGQRLNLAIQSMNREPLIIVHPLADFASQYAKIQ